MVWVLTYKPIPSIPRKGQNSKKRHHYDIIKEIYKNNSNQIAPQYILKPKIGKLYLKKRSRLLNRLSPRDTRFSIGKGFLDSNLTFNILQWKCNMLTNLINNNWVKWTKITTSFLEHFAMGLECFRCLSCIQLTLTLHLLSKIELHVFYFMSNSVAKDWDWKTPEN